MNVPSLRFPEFDGEWKLARFGNISTVIRGASPRPRADPKFYGGSIPRLMVEDVARDGKYVNPRIDFLTKMGAKLSRFCKAGTLTIVCSGTAKTVGQPSFLKVDACIHDGFLAMVDIKKGYLPEFTFYQVERVQKRAESSATHGGTFINLTTSILKDFERAFPSELEQAKIIKFIDLVDDKLTALRCKRDLLADYKRGVMQQIFCQQIRFKRDDGSEFPKWDVKRLGEVATFHRGTNLSKSDLVEDGRFLCIHYGELFTRYEEVIGEVRSKTNVADGLDSVAGDILMPSSDVTPDGLGRASALMEARVKLGGDINVIRPSNAIVSQFLSFAIKHYKREFIRLVTGTTVKHLYSRDLSSVRLPIPHPDEQKKIADFLSTLDAKTVAVSAQITQMEAFKKGLLQQMFV